MIVRTISQHEYERILDREKQLRDRLPEHTLDWYTYDNRVTLLEELMRVAEVKLPEVLPFKEEDKKPEAPETQIIKEGSTKPSKKKAVEPTDIE